MTLTRLLLLLTLAACKHGPPEAAGAPKEIPAPFDADALRAGLPVGTTVLYRLSAPEAPPMLTSWVVVQADEEGLVVQNTMLDDNRDPIGDGVALEKSWEAMEAESRPTPGSELLDLGKQPMALGTLKVTSYFVPNPADEAKIDIITYSKQHPGPPVKLESEVNGEIVLTMEAIEWTVGP